ncbi:MAG: oxidoreductase [Betaproteobacteria bacterium]|nr:oxidoreductase [Betaproteobacteria bacterium]
MTHRALMLRNTPEFTADVEEIETSGLPEGEVLIRASHSTLNYKDALALCNRSPVVRIWPMVAGIDAAGTVEASDHPDFRPGDAVTVNGWGMGETRWGGLSQRVRVPAAWPVRLPSPFGPFEAAALGTAGYTAALCVLALERHGLTPEDGPVLVTGATGGVGSVATMLLARAGYPVVAVTGKRDDADYLRGLGAIEVRDRTEFTAAGKPLQKERYAGAVDALGSHALANVCAQVRRNGAVAACGLAMGMDFPASVAPFILRGIALYGIDSVYATQARRQAAWTLLAQRLSPADLAGIVQKIGLEEAPTAAAHMLAGQVKGRYVVDLA